MDWYVFLDNVYEWVLNIISAVGTVWNWLITPIEIVGLELQPIYLVGVAGIVAGIIKAIVA